MDIELNPEFRSKCLLDNLLKWELKNGKTNHVFICFSYTSRAFAKSIHKGLTKISNKLVVCNHEEDFIPGRSILQNITASIRESIKVVLVLSEDFIKSRWCTYEAECTLCLKLDMKESKTIIPLLTDKYSVVNTPDFLKAFEPIDCTIAEIQWYPKFVEALNTEIKLWQLIKNPSSLPDDKNYHYVTFTSNRNGSHCDHTINQIVERLQQDGFCGKKFCLDELIKTEPFQVVHDIVEALKRTMKVLIFSHEQLNKDRFYLALVKLVKMYIEDKHVKTTSIIPVKLDSTSFPILGESITYLDIDGLKLLDYVDRLKDAVNRTDECRFRFPHMAAMIFNNGTYRVADFECFKTHDDDENPRILDMCYVKINGKSNLVMIDADNMKIKMVSIFGDSIWNAYTFSGQEQRPNRLSKINDTNLAIIYENKLTIALFQYKDNDEGFILTKNLTVDGKIEHIKGFIAHTENYFLLTNGSACFVFEGEQLKGQDKPPNMSLARRFARPIVNNSVFIADENDRRLIWLDNNGEVLYEQQKWNRGLYNVRGIAADHSKIYAAVNNAVMCFNYRLDNMSKTTPHSIQEKADRLIWFQSPVDHNRAICLDNTGQYLCLSQVIDEKDNIRIFCLHC